MKAKLQSIVFITIVSIFLFSCKKNADETATPIIMGNIKGKVFAADNKTPINQATVFVSTKGNIYSTKTDSKGEYILAAPIGKQKLFIQTGKGSMFRTVIDIDIKENQTVTMPAAKLTQVAKLGYVVGSYDKIEDIIVNSLGYTALPIADLHNFSTLTNYDAIFLNCSSNLSVDSVVDKNLANFVSNGGSIYASDWAVAYLMGKNVSGSVCPYIRANGFLPDNTLCTTRGGTSTTISSAVITSTDLANYLGKATIDIHYDLPSWETVNNVDNNFWETMLAHPTTGLPLLVRTDKFTNALAGTINVGVNDSAYVTICHKEANVSTTITIDKADLPLHLAHGDKIGSCESNTNSGRIYFTTFHNEAGGVISNDIKGILQYMILNL